MLVLIKMMILKAKQKSKNDDANESETKNEGKNESESETHSVGWLKVKLIAKAKVNYWKRGLEAKGEWLLTWL